MIRMRGWSKESNLSVLGQDARGDFVDLADELEHRVIGKMLQSKFTLGHVSRISLAKNGVTIAWNDLARVEGRPEVVLDALVREIVSNLGLHLLQPVQDFLISPNKRSVPNFLSDTLVLKIPLLGLLLL